MTSTSKKVFISHIHEDDASLKAMRRLLESHGYSVSDSSVNSSTPNEASSPEYIKQGILAPRIQSADAMIVIISSKTHASDWVDWEIEYAHKHNIRIVGVWLQGATDSDVPRNLDKYADAVVGWQGERIWEALSGKINNWTTSTGELRPARTVPRHCG